MGKRLDYLNLYIKPSETFSDGLYALKHTWHSLAHTTKPSNSNKAKPYWRAWSAPDTRLNTNVAAAIAVHAGVKILDGKVSYDNFLLAFVAPGEILPCCCRVTEDIKLDCRERIKEPDLFDVDLFEDK